MRHDHGEQWCRSDLIRRVHDALDIAGRAVDAAIRHETRAESLPDSSPKHDYALGGVRPLVLKKVVAEAAMLLRCAASLRHADSQISSTIDELARRLTEPARGKQLLAALCLEPTLALDHAAAHIHLGDLGFRDPAVDRLLLEIFQGEVIGGPERLPMQELEHQWLRGIWRGDEDDVSALVARTCIARPIDILGCRTQDLYTFTHVLLYASDMGRQSIAWPRPPEEIVHDADAALAAAIDAGNFDLAAELIWTWPMLRLPWSAAAIFCFGILAALQDEYGFLPGPEYSVEERERLPGELRDEYVLRTSYHATLVMGLACAMALGSPHAPPVVISPMAERRETVEQILRLVHDESREPRWRGAFHQLAASRREALADFLLAIALRRARRSRNVTLLRQCLAVGLRCDIVDGLTARHALALLRRVTMLGQISAENLELASTPSIEAAGSTTG